MKFKDNLLVVIGAAIGGAVGYLAFFWIVRQGFYGLLLPGGLVGVGAGIFKSRSAALSIGCGVLALTLGLFTEWRFAPFVADDSLGYFLLHVHQLKPITMLMIAAGTFIGFWAPFRRSRECGKPPIG